MSIFQIVEQPIEDPVHALVLVLAAGAAAQFRPNWAGQKRPEDQAYLTLRQLLAARYPGLPHDILDVGPASAERQKVLLERLETAEVDKDPAVLRQARHLLQLLARRAPAAATAVFAQPDHLQQAAELLARQQTAVHAP
jgi:hypothetical protein